MVTTTSGDFQQLHKCEQGDKKKKKGGQGRVVNFWYAHKRLQQLLHQDWYQSHFRLGFPKLSFNWGLHVEFSTLSSFLITELIPRRGWHGMIRLTSTRPLPQFKYHTKSMKVHAHKRFLDFHAFIHMPLFDAHAKFQRN